MSIERHLTLSSQDEQLDLEVVRFDYIGKINNGYSIEFLVYTDYDLANFIGARFDFSYSGEYISGGSIRGFVNEAILGYDFEQARKRYKLVCRSVVGFLEDYYLNKLFSDTSNNDVISNILESLCNTQANFIGPFKPLEIQQSNNQLLNGNVFEFFNYQFNNYGFYIVDDNHPDNDIVKVYSQPSDLTGSKASYDIAKPVNKDAISGVRSFNHHTGKIQPSLDVLGYDIDIGQDANISDSPFGVTQDNAYRVFYDNTFKDNDAAELTKRINLSLNSLNTLSKLTLKNITHREGDVIELTNGAESKKYWVYSSNIKASVEESKHWAIENQLEVIELTNSAWYPPLAPKPTAKIVEGFKYNSQKGLGQYSHLPIKTDIPFNETTEVSFARNVSLSSSKTGGVYSSPQSDSRLVLATSDNNQDFVSIGFSSDVTADEYVSNKNIQDSGIHSAGNVALNFTRTRAGQDYSKVSLQSKATTGKISELSLGGQSTTKHTDDFTRNTFASEYPNLEGIIKRSVNSALDITSGDIELNYGDVESVNITKEYDDKVTDHYKHSTTTNDYIDRYFIKSFSENKQDAQNIDTNFITDFKLSTAKIADKIQTTVSWDTQRPSSNKVELDGKQENLNQQAYSFEKEDSNYTVKIPLDNNTNLTAQASNLDENIKSISIEAQPLSKAKTYGLVVGWDVYGNGSLQINGNDVGITQQKAFVELKDSEPLKLDFTINNQTSSLTVNLCEIKTVKSDLQPLPDADEMTTADDTGIYHKSNLEQHIVYTDKMVASEDNPETDTLTWHETYTSKKYSNANSSKLIGQYKANALLKPKTYFDDSLEKAKNNEASLEASAGRTGAKPIAATGGLDFISTSQNKRPTEDKVLKNMPDRDAAVLCELVYEEAVFEYIVKDSTLIEKSLSKVFYDSSNELDKDIKNILISTKSEETISAMDDYHEYYQPILESYKLVATSSEVGNKDGYYGIAVAYVEDEEIKGIYVINRGTTITVNDISSDLEMTLAKSFPVTRVVKHCVAGIDFAKHLKEKYKDPFMAFTGHSLGGSVTQIQSVYFSDSMAPIGQSKCFEPYGVRSEVAPTFRAVNNGTVYYLTINPEKSIKSMACNLGYDWDCDGWQEIEDVLISKYSGDGNIIDKKIVNYIREGDLVGTIAEPIGINTPLKTGLTNMSVGLLHSVSNYRYQGFEKASGALQINQINIDNVKILQKDGTAEQKKKYKACFSLASNYIEV
ncbi:hypothetical protein LO80_01510 [Candidatus Francisella endociliophora]|uniref:Uncharacterized protein n=1 Tax=Candidatus Francisella endociliophora TaxID=653937 RepID=A0A097EMI5_9GAMM|nr:hypothetical protein [Francisella sp. FSC1006]AIT08781.1 hypothetical protein LO80_01510 [Francisella sp. FSC1006]